MVGVKKLGFFRKLLINLGKRLYFRQSGKLNILGLSLMLRELLREYETITGNLPSALGEFTKEVEIQSHEVISKMLFEPVMFGTSLEFALSRDLTDTPYSAQALIYGMIGKNYDKFFEYPIMKLSPEGDGEIIIGMKQCIICGAVTDISQEDLKDKNYGDIVSTLFGTVFKEVWEYMELPYTVIDARETKCFLRGDSCGEITIRFKVQS